MDVDQQDIVEALTTQGPQFQDNWSKFMFNIEMALQMREKKVTKEKILDVLTAGSAYLGGGWSTGRASKVLYDMSGVAIVKSQIEPYRDTWLYCLALLLGVDLPLWIFRKIVRRPPLRWHTTTTNVKRLPRHPPQWTPATARTNPYALAGKRKSNSYLVNSWNSGKEQPPVPSG